MASGLHTRQLVMRTGDAAGLVKIYSYHVSTWQLQPHTQHSRRRPGRGLDLLGS